MTAEAIAAAVRSGEIAEDALVCVVGTSVWKPMGDVVELAMAGMDLEPDTEQVPMERLTASFGQDRQPDQGGQDDEDDDMPTIRPDGPPGETC